ELAGTHNHPLLCLVNLGGIPTLMWRLLDEVQSGDRVVLQRVTPDELGAPELGAHEAAILAGAFVSEGWASERRAGFSNVDRNYFQRVLKAYDLAVGGRRYVSERVIASGSKLYELDVQDLTALRMSILGELIGQRSHGKRVPGFVWGGSTAIKRAFLQSLFEGDGSCSLLPRGTIQISYSTRSPSLASGTQQLLLEFGVVSRLVRYHDGEIKIVVTKRRDARIFLNAVGFLGRKQRKLEAALANVPAASRALSSDHCPYL